MSRHGRVVAFVAAGLVAVTTAPYLAAARRPPAPGARFTGAFFYQDDYYQYLSFVEQGMRGRVVFANKFDPSPHRPRVVNVEWWLAGVAGRLLGGSPVLGFHAIRIAAIVAMIAAAARLLARAGGEPWRVGWGLVLFATAAGPGWVRLSMGAPGHDVADVLMGIYPFHQSLMNPHFVFATALLLWTLVLYLEWNDGRRARWGWVAAAWVLGMSRPYDLVTFCAAAVVAGPLRGAPGRALALAWTAPVYAYYLVLLRPGRGEAGWTGLPIERVIPSHELALAVLPAALLVAAFWKRAAPDQRPVRAALLACAAVAGAVATLIPSPIAKQFVTAVGPALLLLAASVAPRRLLAPAAIALAPTSAFLLWRVLNPLPEWFMPANYARAIDVLRDGCADGEVALAPTDLSLMIAGLTPCRVALGHRVLTPDWPRAIADGTRFYDPATPAGWRLAYLDSVRATWVLLPRGGGSLLAGDARYARALELPLLEVWRRAPSVPAPEAAAGSDGTMRP